MADDNAESSGDRGKPGRLSVATNPAQALAFNRHRAIWNMAARPLKMNELSPEEERVIVHKGTERPFSGEYERNFKPGTYVCRRCEAPLYRSEDKFDARCGWPAFDDEIPGSVKRVPTRTETGRR